MNEQLQNSTENRDTVCEKFADPFNPFENETEFRDYNRDYSAIVPQLRLAGCSLPLFPGVQERRGIRRSYSRAGVGLLLHMIFSNALSIGFMMLFYSLQTLFDTAASGGELPDNYDILLEEHFWSSSSNGAMNLLVFMFANLVVAIIGCKFSGITIPSLFRTKRLHPGPMLLYILIAIGLQHVCGYAANFISDFLAQADITAYEPDFSTGQDIKFVVISAIYGCIVAPVTEELLFRGFVLKNMSVVSQRFGIIASAVLFGLWHENIAQFILAFAVGILMGYLTVKHDSLVPAILCHMAVNTAATIYDICYTYQWYMAYTVFDCIYNGLAAIGVFMLIVMIIRERLPHTTPCQQERGLRIAATSLPLILVTAAHLVMTVLLIMDSSSG
ncbi:MAG: CPBP family intramembrane metalloprotease [Oscillospiraceae bacterium]|nr:CPBP family intramembrane metalloprotease [Oscillospiraceae bacterium]